MKRKRGRKSLVEQHPEVLAEIGTAPDHVIAAKYGVTSATICNLRKKHGVSYHGSLSQKLGRPDSRNEDFVVVVARFDGTTAQVLNSHEGIRVYHKDRLDYRLTMGGPLPSFDTWTEAEAHLMVEPGAHRPCLIPLSVARQVFTDSFAPPDAESLAAPIVGKITEAAKDGRGVTLTADEVRALAG